MSTTVWTLCLVLLVGNTATSLESENIVGGLLAKQSQFQYQISLQNVNSHICGGTLIAPDLVLTAAHCVCDHISLQIKDLLFMAVAGTTKIGAPAERIVVTKIYSHAGFTMKNNIGINDIAVLRLQENFDVSGRSPNIGLALLPNKWEDFLGYSATVSGFGFDQATIVKNPLTLEEQRIGSSSGVLRYETVNIEVCENALKDNPTILCGRMSKAFEAPPKGVCSGDSGGSLAVGSGIYAKIAGIAIASPLDCNEANMASRYTKVSEYLSFIDNAYHDRPGRDTIVKTLNTKVYYISYLNWKVVTKSTNLQTILENIQRINVEYDMRKKELNEIDKSMKEIGKILSNFIASGTSNPEYDSYLARHAAEVDRYNAKLKEFNHADFKMDYEVKKLQLLMKTEKLYNI